MQLVEDILVLGQMCLLGFSAVHEGRDCFASRAPVSKHGFDFLVLLFWVSGIVAEGRTDLYVSEAFHKAFIEVSFILSQDVFCFLFFKSMKHNRKNVTDCGSNTDCLHKETLKHSASSCFKLVGRDVEPSKCCITPVS